MALYQKNFQNALDEPGNSYDKQNIISSYVQSLNNLKPEMASVYVIDQYGNLFYNYKTDGIRRIAQSQFALWEKLAHEANGLPVVVRTQEVTLSSSDASTDFVFSIIKELRSPTTLQPNGMIIFDTKISIFERMVRELDAVTKGNTVILDNHNFVIYDSNRKLLTKNLSLDPDVMKTLGM